MGIVITIVMLWIISYLIIKNYEVENPTTSTKISDKHKELIEKEHAGLSRTKDFWKQYGRMKFTIAFLLLSLTSFAQTYSPNGEFCFDQIDKWVETCDERVIIVDPERTTYIDDLGHIYQLLDTTKIYYCAPWDEKAVFIEYDKNGEVNQLMIISEQTFIYNTPSIEIEGFKTKNKEFLLLWKN